MTPELSAAMEGVVFALSLGYTAGIAFVVIILLIRQPRGGE